MTVPLPIGGNGKPVDVTRADNTYSTVTLAPSQPLGEDVDALVTRLSGAVTSQRHQLQTLDAYYQGTASTTDLGISVPPVLRQLKVALGWPRVCVDAVEERLDIEGFRFPDASDTDAALWEMWQANDMEHGAHLVHLDALVFGRGFVAVGTGDGDYPLISVESPLDFAADWDARTRTIRAALRLMGSDRDRQATLYLPDATLYLTQGSGSWRVDDIDDHRLGRVPVVRVANRPRSFEHAGTSEITPEIMSITDEATRTLKSLATAREFYSGPQRYILGAQESDFVGPDGQPKTTWETYLGRVLAIERDPNGDIPTVGQFAAYDPAVFTRVIDMYARIISSITGLPPHVLGYTSDNPASADAIRSSETRLKLKADRKTRLFGDPWCDVMRLALLIRDGQERPDARLLTPVWADTATPTPAATTDSIAKQIAAGSIPATSDVTLARLGYSAIERARLAQDRAAVEGDAMMRDIASALVGKPQDVVAGQ